MPSDLCAMCPVVRSMAASAAGLLLVLQLFTAVQAAELYKVCLVQNPGFANCSADTDQSTYTGVDVELINTVAQFLGWVQVAPGTNTSLMTQPAYQFVCTNIRVPAVVNILSSVNTSTVNDCALGAGAFTATSARVQMGVRFSWPHVHSDLGVMVTVGKETVIYDRWAFLRPFHSSIWIAIIMTVVFCPILISVFENLIQTGRLPVGKSLLIEWRHAIHVMLLCCFNLATLEVLSAPCQIMVICFAFTNLIMVASYTANLAAVLTARASLTGITSLSDLVGKNVYAHGVYTDRLLRNDRIRAQPLDWGGQPFFLQVENMLLDHSIDAYIFDRHILQYYINAYTQGCQLNLLSDTNLEPFDYGIAFHQAVSEDVVRNFSFGVLQAQSAGLLSLFEERYLSAPSTDCGSDSYNGALMFAQVSGLFIILGCAAALGLLASIFSIWRHHVYLPRLQKKVIQEAVKKLDLQSNGGYEYQQSHRSLQDGSFSYHPPPDGALDPRLVSRQASSQVLHTASGSLDKGPGSRSFGRTIMNSRSFGRDDGIVNAAIPEGDIPVNRDNWTRDWVVPENPGMASDPNSGLRLEGMKEEEEDQQTNGDEVAQPETDHTITSPITVASSHAWNNVEAGLPHDKLEEAVTSPEADDVRASRRRRKSMSFPAVGKLAVRARSLAKKVFVLEGSQQEPFSPPPLDTFDSDPVAAAALERAIAAAGLQSPPTLVKITNANSFICKRQQGSMPHGVSALTATESYMEAASRQQSYRASPTIPRAESKHLHHTGSLASSYQHNSSMRMSHPIRTVNSTTSTAGLSLNPDSRASTMRRQDSSLYYANPISHQGSNASDLQYPEFRSSSNRLVNVMLNSESMERSTWNSSFEQNGGRTTPGNGTPPLPSSTSIGGAGVPTSHNPNPHDNQDGNGVMNNISPGNSPKHVAKGRSFERHNMLSFSNRTAPASMLDVSRSTASNRHAGTEDEPQPGGMNSSSPFASANLYVDLSSSAAEVSFSTPASPNVNTPTLPKQVNGNPAVPAPSSPRKAPPMPTLPEQASSNC